MQRNRDHLTRWNAFPESLFERSGWIEEIKHLREQEQKDQSVMLGLFLVDRPGRMVGTAVCTDIRGLPFSSGEIGFSIDSLLAGRGLMLDALSLLIRHIFARYGINRLTARVASGNERSLKVLSILGFEIEGIERQSLYLHDAWVDCQVLALLRNRVFSQP
jgi:ribosomal-protein-alanine N-acetyltransferase